ncbi:hypothetical protein [Indioceanicola profundi]|nr:hypothetical protein [Indioceanicola profundi]
MTMIATNPRPSMLSSLISRLPAASDLLETVPVLSAAIVMVVTLNGLF